jgi:3D-(3,5/4)-trihydroxycyclohexane-1,2-dione acylhydrolase (decyclizing)
VRTTDELRRALAEARAETRSCLIEVAIEPHRYLPGSGVWWDVAPAEVSDDAETRALREEFERGREGQRLHV